MMSTDQIFDLTVPNALGGYFMSSLSMCNANSVTYTVPSGTSTGVSILGNNLRLKIAANSVFEGSFSFVGQIVERSYY
jgi:hypothetical protein